MTDDFIDLLELQIRCKDGLEGLFPEKLWVKAEIASIQVKSNGHCYLDLSQTDGTSLVAKAKAVIWRSHYPSLSHYFESVTGTALQSGMSVLVRVQVNYSELYSLTLVIDEIEPQFTLGQAEAVRRRTMEMLKADDMMDRQKRLSLTELPYRLAVISAPDAAGYGDFRRHLEENAFGFKFSVNLFEAVMQGSGAPESITEALQMVESDAENYDAALIMRGGGSSLDLSCFDDYGLCVAIASCGIPVFTAIGHDRDYHVADMVSYDYVKTPTALADIFLDCYMAEDERLSAFESRFRLAFSSRIAAMESAVDVLETRIHAADPRALLSRGYTLVTDSGGVVIKSSGGLAKGDSLRVYFSDGRIDVEIK